MTQVWLIDEDGFFLGEDKKVEEVTDGMTTVPLLVGHIKPKFDGIAWVEGATEQEILEHKKQQQIDILSIKKNKVKDSKELLAEWLVQNPLLSQAHNSNGELYTVTEEKQSLLSQNLMMAQLKQSPTTTWNSQGGVCEEWQVTELVQLAMEIEAYVRPRIKKQQEYEVAINACSTAEEVEAIEIEYETIA